MLETEGVIDFDCAADVETEGERVTRGLELEHALIFPDNEGNEVTETVRENRLEIEEFIVADCLLVVVNRGVTVRIAVGVDEAQDDADNNDDCVVFDEAEGDFDAVAVDERVRKVDREGSFETEPRVVIDTCADPEDDGDDDSEAYILDGVIIDVTVDEN